MGMEKGMDLDTSKKDEREYMEKSLPRTNEKQPYHPTS